MLCTRHWQVLNNFGPKPNAVQENMSKGYRNLPLLLTTTAEFWSGLD